MGACYSNSWGISAVAPCKPETTQEEREPEQLVLNQAATMSLFDTGAPTQKKPSASQQRRFELHTCLRSYSQLTLTQPRHQKKGKSSSHPARQEGRRADRQEGSLFWNLAYLLYLAFFFFLLPNFPHVFFIINFLHLHFSSLHLCQVPPVSLCVCLASHSCHSRAPQGLLSRHG